MLIHELAGTGHHAGRKESLPMKLESLHDVLVDGVRDLYHAEKQLI